MFFARTGLLVTFTTALAIAASMSSTRTASADVQPSPSPSASATGAGAKAKVRPRPERIAFATCSRTYFYSWPVRDAAPSTANYPPATNGDAFHLIGDPQLTYGGMVLIETTIDVVEPWGAGKHYWVAESCVTAG